MKRLLSLLFLMLFTLRPANAQEWTVPTVSAQPSYIAPLTPNYWETLKTTNLVLHGDPRDDRSLLKLGQAGENALKRLSVDLDVPIGPVIHIFLTTSEKQFQNLQPGTPPAWADGTAYPSAGAIFLKSPRIRPPQSKPLDMVLTHELTHVLFGRAFAPQQPPTWLQEGVAQLYAGENDPDIIYRMSRGGPLLSLDELHRGFPQDPQRADLAYAQSADFISWIRMEHGDQAIPLLLRELRAGSTLDRAIRVTTGLYVHELDQAWRDRLNSGAPLWMVQFGKSETWWGIISFAAGIALIMAYRRRRMQLREYAEAELARDALIAMYLKRRAAERRHRTGGRGQMIRHEMVAESF